MKTIHVRELQKKIHKAVDASQNNRVVVTRHGKPAALPIGLEGGDWEDVVLQTSAPFWNLIEKRRREGSISLKQMRRRARA